MLNFKSNLIIVIFKYFLILLIINSINCANETDIHENDFIPTKEWQVVKPGQKVPPGLHIRSNLQTGVTEAKLLDKNDRSSSNTAVLVTEDNHETPNDTIQSYSPDQLKKMLKGIKDESPVENESIDINGTKFRSYEQLKKEFESVRMSIKTDLEIIRELLDELKSDVSVQRVATILVDLEYYLHQIDNAQNFVDMGGLAYLHRFMESNDRHVKSEALRCLSSALQGNSKVKVEALKNGTLSRLLIHLKSSSTDISIINQILVAVSALTRQFPIAQLAFINGGGLQIIGEVYDRFSIDGNEKTSVRLITLLSDWLKERNFEEVVVSSESEREIITEKMVQYKRVDLNSPLLVHGWCTRFMSLLSATADNRSVDYLEKLVTSVGNIYPVCRSEDAKNTVATFLDRAHKSLSAIAREDSGDDFYFREVLRLVEDTMSLVSSDGQSRVEL